MAYALAGLDHVEQAPHGLTAYSWRGVCRVGACSNPATDPHHVVPRGRTGGPVRYVIIDGEVWANVAGLCRLHHDRITRGDSLIEWRPYEQQRGWWYRSPSRTVRLRPLGQAEACVDRGGRGCPHCGQGLPRPRAFELRPRERQAFVVAAPVDEGENGPAMLASLAEQVAERIGMDAPASLSARYHAVTTALTAVLLHDDALQGLRQHAHGMDR